MSGRLFRRSRAALAGLGLCGAATVAALAATTGTASAAQPEYYAPLTAQSSGLDLDVSGASTAAGAPVIQAPADGGYSQDWATPGVGSEGRIWNLNSRMCLTTDGVAGDQLYQKPCIRRLARYERWAVYGISGSIVVLYNTYFGLAVDVYQNSLQAGAPIDAWPYNGQPNQEFSGSLT
jgi:hypothetical protein